MLFNVAFLRSFDSPALSWFLHIFSRVSNVFKMWWIKTRLHISWRCFVNLCLLHFALVPGLTSTVSRKAFVKLVSIFVKRWWHFTIVLQRCFWIIATVLLLISGVVDAYLQNCILAGNVALALLSCCYCCIVNCFQLTLICNLMAVSLLIQQNFAIKKTLWLCY